MRIDGGGWVTGPAGEVYARTDVGGAYRWDEPSRSWQQLITSPGVPDPSDDDYRVESIAVAPSNGKIVYVAVGSDLKATSGRILRSTDGGRTWREGGQRFAIHGNEAYRWAGERLAVHPRDPKIVTFGTRTEGLWRSIDSGATWRRTALPTKAVPAGAVPAGVMFSAFQAGTGDLATPATMWAGVENVGILRSTDTGRSWKLVHAVTKGIPRDHAFGPDGQLYVTVHGSPSQVVRIDLATSAATTISPATSGTFATVAADPHRPGRLVVGMTGVGDGRLWRSDDRGATWSRLDVAIAGGWTEQTDIAGWMSAGKLSFDRSRPGRLWFAEGMGVWTTSDLDDGEVTFDFTSAGIEELVSNDAVKPRGDALLTAHWDRPVFRHAEGEGATPSLTGRFNAAWDLDVADDDPSFVAAVVDDHRFLDTDGLAGQSGWSTDGGRTWQRFPSLEDGTHPAGLAFGNIAVSTGDHDNLVWAPSNGGKVHVTTDGGRTWRQPASYPGTETHMAHHLSRRVLAADPVATGTFYAFDIKGLLRSTDGGRTWAKMGGRGLPDWWARRYNATLTAVPGRVGHLLLSVGHLDTGAFGLLRSTDGGASWSTVGDLEDAGTFDVGPATTPGGPPTIFATGTGAGTDGLWRTVDDGASWELVSTAPLGIHQGIKVVTADPDVAGQVYVGFSGSGFAVGRPRP